MRILYGVQATGNGHITRARVLLPALQAAGAEVDMLFSGRDQARLFNMEPFGDYAHREGLTFVTDAGRVQRWQTLTHNRPLQLVKDIRALDLNGYDLVLTDFEPVTAWAARRSGVPSVGIAHQYAFLHRIPGTGFMPWLKPCIRFFAPADEMIGLHWHAFNAPILPPMIEPVQGALSEDETKVLVYLPFEAQDEIIYWLSGFSDFRFRVYAGVDQPRRIGNIELCPFSREGFQQDLYSCRGVIANAGFGLCSEAIQAGKSLLVKPLRGQVEQISNAAVLEQMGLAWVMPRFGQEPIERWLELPSGAPMPWPDVAGTLARWITTGRQVPLDNLARELWHHRPDMSVSPA
ncbi:MJ1255/VC2487 family glycosyltransferase [Marinobacterium stanieri]|uniref:MJ1255/VC2487 family glycosyltransferase n=1 Tax=Marinobacterium stanieri TaxID=49186 RepID=UPI0002559641|nr:MJ1255/VC2487 family glycosyltransferase [Marinobacterium stanieri]